MAVRAGKDRTGLPSTTIPRGSTLQAIGNGNVWLLTGNAEDDELVWSHVKT